MRRIFVSLLLLMLPLLLQAQESPACAQSRLLQLAPTLQSTETRQAGLRPDGMALPRPTLALGAGGEQVQLTPAEIKKTQVDLLSFLLLQACATPCRALPLPPGGPFIPQLSLSRIGTVLHLV
jgi:hypothetical protein